MGHEERSEYVDGSYLDEESGQWLALVNKLMDFGVP
jgi:hypothetical protein